MSESVVPAYLTLHDPSEIPGLISFWRFDTPGESFRATSGRPYMLRSQSGTLSVVQDSSGPLGGTALSLNEGQWLNILRADCPDLDFHGPTGTFTVVAWLKRGTKSNGECEFIAGMWNESGKSRQYGLFLNIGVWQQRGQVTGHLSNVGGATPGYKYCIDGPVGATSVPKDRWSVVGMSYDGHSGYAWLDGNVDIRGGLNPYAMSGGLYNGGASGSDFTVGAVDRSGTIGNFFTGEIAGLAIYGRPLTPAEMFALSRL